MYQEHAFLDGVNLDIAYVSNPKLCSGRWEAKWKAALHT